MIERYFSRIILTGLLGLFSLILLPKIILPAGNPSLIEMKAKLETLHLSRASSPQDHLYTFRFNEYPDQAFLAKNLDPVDQQILVTKEKKGTEMTFSIEKKSWDDKKNTVHTLKRLKSAQNIYIDQKNLTAILNKDWYFMLFLFLSLGGGCTLQYRKLKKLSQKLAKNPSTPLVFDPFLVRIAVFTNQLGIPLKPTSLLGRALESVEKTATQRKQTAADTKGFAESAQKIKRTIEMLQKTKNGLNTQNAHGQTALHIACASGHFEMIDGLLMHGAKIDIQDKDGKTALMLAAHNGHAAAVDKLIARGCHLRLQDQFGLTAFDHAQFSKNDAIIEKIKKELEKLPVLHGLIKEGNYQKVYDFLKGGADPDIFDDTKTTPLIVAVENKREGLVKLLLEKGANPLHQDKTGRSPLSIAQELKHVELIALLTQSVQTFQAKSAD